MKFQMAFLALALAALGTGCKVNDEGYKAGELGNGGFYFSCDDAVACSKYSDDAKKFPSAVSLGSTFSVRFVPKEDSSISIKINESAPDKGITVSPVADFVSKGPKGLAGVKSGYATLASRDAAGKLIDYVVIRVAKPDALVVYSADESRTDPPRVDSVELVKGDRKSYKAFAQEKKADLAGSLQLEWTSSNTAVFDVEKASDGRATIVAKTAGSADLVAVGGTFTQRIPVEVKP